MPSSTGYIQREAHILFLGHEKKESNHGNLLFRVYQVPGELFEVPTSYVWIFTARLVTGQGLPPLAKEWAIGSAVLFAATTALRISATNKHWQALIPGGIAVAVGMYNVPSFTLARTMGGLLSWWWRSVMGWQDTPLIVLASVSAATICTM